MLEADSIQKAGETRIRELGVAEVILDGFRNYDHLQLSLSPGFNVLAGRNAQGKTNFLEALYLLATTRLLRGQRDAEAVYDGRSRAIVAAEMLEGRSRLAITLERGVRKRASLNGLNLPRAADLIGRLPCVSIGSEDMAIVRGEPTDRRLFLDLELSSLYPGYLRHLTLYKRALEQRNALLRDARENAVPAALYEPWEAQLAEHGAALRVYRRNFVDRLAPTTETTHARMGSGEKIRVAYAAKDETADSNALADALAATRMADVARGGTSCGPHRDDMTVEIEGREGRLYGSQGQQRTSVIAVKIATLEVARQELGVPPLLLLDDILSDLDERRRALLVEVVLENAGQAVLTCTEADSAGARILEQARVFEVVSGTVNPL
ncbi:DNA replication/repair protein RecF [Fimbriimonas ginsengisoli]|uniref:DNA replication and repair protein RecF n=1 Tax=Fimbriimonas ginsengisoli Gsoil 348 TaxID=661478 RepID=A0A068NU76_FIMGI|nr:DNA replication/repair protein RecF [Fimbriimonas ginsengisoli]AIE85154.1 DNA recombination and repair protein RecF [Fimbriimonas ginsengisoli Gsoil 348]